MKSAELRSAFLEFFRRNGHEIVPTSPLIPGNDPTLLFTNAGMVQFKDVFLGLDKRSYTRAASSQRCVRAGGKHNDLENVGYTARHHTFFEMLGNFSFGDYFKHDAIRFAWEFLTKDLKLSPAKLWVTVYKDDDEAATIWLKEIGVDPNRITRLGEKSNFWQMGDTGPCGPCTEIFYDHGPEVAGGPPGSPDEDGDRYIEIWNLVFMQFNRQADGTLEKLPKPSVDTGMGLERLAAVMQGVHSNYEIDLFVNLLKAAQQATGAGEASSSSLKVIADHIRSCSFLITDGVVPSNEGRGSVLRRITRRAIRHGYKLGQQRPFFHKLVATLVQEMGEAYPELVKAKDTVIRVLRQEEERFAETLHTGMVLLENVIAGMSEKVIPGDMVFKLYDTYGFPSDLTADIARERGLSIDIAGFDKAMDEQRKRGRAAKSFAAHYAKALDIATPTQFTGYERLADSAKVLGIYIDGSKVDAIVEGQHGMIVLDRSPFYAESGGQAGDGGALLGAAGKFVVEDTQKQGNDVFGHLGRVTLGTVRAGETVQCQVDAATRQATRYNHSATHLLHAALRKILGEHVTQKGSLVEADRLRFDFSHFEAVTPAQLQQIEDVVNTQIRNNHLVETNLMSQEAAKQTGAMALFGEKYADTVRVLKMGDFSLELCGGTHVNRTGDIGLFKILMETGTAAGVRRIEALTGQKALEYVNQNEGKLAQLAQLLKGSRDDVTERIRQLLDRSRQLEKDLDQIKGKLASSQGDDLAGQALDISGIKVLAARLDSADVRTLRDTLDQLKNKLGSAAVVLAAVNDGKIDLVAGVSKENTSKLKAGELINMVAQQVGGKGGGRPDMAQAGGTQPEHLDKALASVTDWVRQKVS